MAKINRTVIINGEKRWIHAQTEQEYADKLAKLCGSAPKPKNERHPFKEYALNWFELYAVPNIETVTRTTYRRQLDLYLIPAFGEADVADITVDMIQKLFNDMTGAKSTKLKVKVVLNMILEAAIDEEIIARNPLKSRRLKTTGADSKFTPEYSVEQMRYLVAHIPDLKRVEDRMYLALQALHPLRLEEVLGLKWGDVDLNAMTLRVCRAVTHPTRHLPEIKVPKTESSIRTLGLSGIAARYLVPGEADAFVIGGKEPYTYTKVRRMCERIRRETGFEDKITPIRFRTTVLTDIYDRTKDVKAAQAAAGHTTPAMTLKHYVKGREGVGYTADVIDDAYRA